MTDSDELSSCPPTGQAPTLDAAFLSLNYHFGMLLGVADFQTEQAYHRAKMRLHNLWLHREGVVWGFGVDIDTAKGEIRVLPGLALDAVGREIHLQKPACLSVAAWLKEHRQKDPNLFKTEGNTVSFNADVVIRFKSCLTRQVPALLEPCNQAETATAYSRVVETVEIRLVPFREPPPTKTPPYHRLRCLFGLDEPSIPAEQKLKDKIAAIATTSDKLKLFGELAALDTIDLRPPEGDDFPILLARIAGLTLTTSSSGDVLTFTENNVAIRPVLVATAVLQELLSGA